MADERLTGAPPCQWIADYAHAMPSRAITKGSDILAAVKQEIELPKNQFLAAASGSAKNRDQAIVAECRAKIRQGLPLAVEKRLQCFVKQSLERPIQPTRSPNCGYCESASRFVIDVSRYYQSSGAKEIRTLDLCIANAALSQLSYRPKFLPIQVSAASSSLSATTYGDTPEIR